jgi:hypothetical protein
VLLVLALIVVVVVDPGQLSHDGGSANAAEIDTDQSETDQPAAAVASNRSGASASNESGDAFGSDASQKLGTKLRFDLDTDPSGATARIGGRTIGNTPLVYEAEPDMLPQEVIFEMEGYREAARELTSDGVPVVVEVLVEAPAARAAQQRQGSSRGARVSSRAGSGAKKEQEKTGERSKKLSDDKVEKVLDELLVE